MLVSSCSKQHARHPRPWTFMGLMDLYEENYIRMRRLCPEIRSLSGRAVSVVQGNLDLHLVVGEQSTYTTTAILTYELGGAHRAPHREPNVRIRIYHDARQAEVLSRTCRGGGEVRASDFAGASELNCRWRLNRFLYKWLGYCRHLGHRFDGFRDPEWPSGGSGGAASRTLD